MDITLCDHMKHLQHLQAHFIDPIHELISNTSAYSVLKIG